MTPDHPHHTSPGSARSRFHRLEGAALIIVLSCLVLVTTLIIGFLSRSQTERGNSVSYRGGTGSRNLADYAVNVVMAQIRAATTGDNAVNAWASQPGAIRVYSSTANTLQAIYKLYSAPDMVENAFPTADLNLTGWSNNTAFYTDLNAPVVTGSGAACRTNYPILDPGAQGVVQGFAISGAPNPTPLQPIPMPVSWLYVLEDGTLVAPIGTGNTATVTGATSNNPITGRIAFWTDDDTCKININTASGAPWNYTNTTTLTAYGRTTVAITNLANYWDTPVIGSPQDVNLALSQPWAGEYQRYPGHPATVSLSAVFTNLSTNDIMSITPRVNYQNNSAGSRWGTFVAVNTAGGNQNVFKLQDDGARLYANVDELLFATNRSATGTNPITPRQIEQARFFLTASSRAPDVTLFNTPRLLCWPITTSKPFSAYDQLITFCGTVGNNTDIGGNNSYYFTRQNPSNSTTDYNILRNQTLLGYFRRMTTTAVPGFGGPSGILGKYGANEAEQITTEIFDYIRCINVRQNLGSGGIDTTYMYSASGGIVPTAGANNTRGFGRFPTITKVGMVFWFNNYFTNQVVNTFTNPSSGVINTQTNTLTNVSLCARLIFEPFYASHGHPSPVTNNHRINVTGLTGLRWGVMSNGVVLVTNPVTGLVSTNNTNQIIYANIFAADAAPAFSVINSGRPHGGRISFQNQVTSGFIATSPTNANLATRFFNTDTTTVVTNAANTNQTVPYTDSTFHFSGGTLRFTINDATGVTIQTINVNLPAIQALPVPLDTYTTNWVSPTTVSFNGPSAWSTINFSWTNALDPSRRSTNLGRTIQQSNHRFRPEDVVRAVGVSHGDFRLIAANRDVGTTSFATIDGGVGAYNSTDPNQRIAHNFIGEYPYASIGGRFPQQNYYNSTNTNFTAGLTNSTREQFGPIETNNANPARNGKVINWSTNGLYTWINGDSARITNTSFTGDFDNGYGAAGDGPYIGFADEGNARIFESYAGAFIPYLDGSGAQELPSEGYFSPNRLVPSAGIMGSLPTGVISQTPWQTLLFRPAALTSLTHPGLGTPPDYLLLDLFNMPVVEPYAISEPLSTAGRVNMNYQILPFTYIKRSTALQAALHTEWITAIPNIQNSVTLIGDTSRKTGGLSTGLNRNSRWRLNLSTTNGTLVGFEQRFGSNDIFRSAAEICSIPLVPTNSNWSSVTNTNATSTNPSIAFWPNYSLTGDNSKERPYARIYPKLTTKSNTYTIHYRVEVLKKRPNTAPDKWTEGQEKVLSTYRGSTTIERYVNPRDPALPDYASLTTLPPTGANALPNFYKFRVVGERQFNP